MILAVDEDRVRQDDEMTESRKLAKQMSDDITSGKIAPQDRITVRRALDKADAPLEGKAKADEAVRGIFGRG